MVTLLIFNNEKRKEGKLVRDGWETVGRKMGKDFRAGEFRI